MTQSGHPARAHPGPPVPRVAFTLRPLAAVGVAVAILGLQLAALALLGRDLGCACARTRLWGGLAAADSSRHWTDPYSALHLGFGLGLFLLFSRLRPGWRLRDLALVVLFSHAVWEVAENLPLLVGRFHDVGAGLPYRGDSLANSFGDTVFALLGVALGRRLTAAAILAIILALEGAVTLLIGDGYLLGLLRLAGMTGGG